jgi:hypothetical protein
MEISKNFILFKKREFFDRDLATIPNTKICFIEDTKEIWAKGMFFDGSTFDPSNLEKSIEEIDNLIGNNTTNRTIVERIEAVENQTIPDARSKVFG